MAHCLIIVVGEYPDRQLKPFSLYAGGSEREDEDWKYDWYEIGGRFSGCLKIKEPRKPNWLSSLLGIEATTGVNQAKKREIKVEELAKVFPFELLRDGQWYEEGLEDESAREHWCERYMNILRELPDDTLLTAVDYHM